MKYIKILTLIILSVILTFCGGKSDEALFNDGKSLITQKKYDEAVVTFEKLVDQNNNSELAPKALFECAKIYQGQVIKNLDAKESLVKSVDMYKKIFSDYPSSEVAENSLFMAGFIQANELKDFNAAKKTYELYLKKYPEGKLVKDAKVELQNLGKSPEEILKDKIKKEMLDAKKI